MPEYYPSLFIVTNSEEAKWFVIEETGVPTLLFTLQNPHEHYSDREGFFTSSGHGTTYGAGEPEIINGMKEEQIHHHLKQVAEKTKELYKESSYQELSVALPESHKNRILDEMGKTLPGVQVHLVYGNYTHEQQNEIRNLFIKSLQPK